MSTLIVKVNKLLLFKKELPDKVTVKEPKDIDADEDAKNPNQFNQPPPQGLGNLPQDTQHNVDMTGMAQTIPQQPQVVPQQPQQLQQNPNVNNDQSFQTSNFQNVDTSYDYNQQQQQPYDQYNDQQYNQQYSGQYNASQQPTNQYFQNNQNF